MKLGGGSVFVWAALVGLWASPSAAQKSPNGEFVFFGATPTPSCATWTSLRRTGRGQELTYWVLGFVSGYNRWAPNSGGNIGGSADAEALLAWVDRYCESNPLDTYVQAAFRLIEELETRAR